MGRDHGYTTKSTIATARTEQLCCYWCPFISFQSRDELYVHFSTAHNIWQGFRDRPNKDLLLYEHLANVSSFKNGSDSAENINVTVAPTVANNIHKIATSVATPEPTLTSPTLIDVNTKLGTNIEVAPSKILNHNIGNNSCGVKSLKDIVRPSAESNSIDLKKTADIPTLIGQNPPMVQFQNLSLQLAAQQPGCNNIRTTEQIYGRQMAFPNVRPMIPRASAVLNIFPILPTTQPSTSLKCSNSSATSAKTLDIKTSPAVEMPSTMVKQLTSKEPEVQSQHRKLVSKLPTQPIYSTPSINSSALESFKIRPVLATTQPPPPIWSNFSLPTYKTPKVKTMINETVPSLTIHQPHQPKPANFNQGATPQQQKLRYHPYNAFPIINSSQYAIDRGFSYLCNPSRIPNIGGQVNKPQRLPIVDRKNEGFDLDEKKNGITDPRNEDLQEEEARAYGFCSNVSNNFEHIAIVNNPTNSI